MPFQVASPSCDIGTNNTGKSDFIYIVLAFVLRVTFEVATTAEAFVAELTSERFERLARARGFVACAGSQRRTRTQSLTFAYIRQPPF